MLRWTPIAILGLLCAALWWFRSVAASYGMFGGTLALALDVTASVATGVLVVLLLAEATIGLIFVSLASAKPTGFERVAVYAILCIAAVAIILAHLGVNVTAVLATSAALTAIVGLALQPTMTAVIAGLTLSADRVLKVGDGIVHNSETLTVATIGWRAVTATKGDGTRVFLAHSRILDGTYDILPAAQPVRAEFTFLGPLAGAPNRISEIVTAIVADIAFVDPGRPISVAPDFYDPEKAQARYRVRYWLRAYARRQEVQEEILGRLWYALQREGLEWPVSVNFVDRYGPSTPSLSGAAWTRPLERALGAALRSRDATVFWNLSVEAVTEAGTLLLYGDGERLVMPSRVNGWRCIILEGGADEIAFELSNVAEQSESTATLRQSGARSAELRALTTRLASSIGPYAEYAVQRAARDQTDLASIRDIVATEIEDEAARHAFLATQLAPTGVDHGPGYLFDLRRGTSGLLQPEPMLRAKGPLAVVAIPAALFGR